MKTTKTITGLVIVLLGAWLLHSCDRPATPVPQKATFEQTLAIHLNAIKTSNMTDLEPTVADNVAMIGPDGTKMDSKKVFIEFHKEWFKQTGWEWQGDIVKTESSDSLGYALINYHFIKKDSLGAVLFQDNEYLVLIFKNSADGWQLVHDQNTGIK